MIKNLNYILILVTIVALSAIGLVFIYGSGYSWVLSIQSPQWRQTGVYQDYTNSMNLAVLPLAVALTAVLGLCIPKRLFSGAALLQIMGALLFMTIVGTFIIGPQPALGFLLITAILMQLVVIALTVTGSRRLHYETQGFYVQIGSAVLHLGLILFLFDFVILPNSPQHLNVFWLATAFIGVGMVMTFYSRELSRERG